MTDEEMIDCPEDGKQMGRLRAIMHRLRAPGGCPWDAEQTHVSLVPNLIEESYECVDAIQRGDHEHLREELGDLLLQVVFHSELAEEAGRYRFEDVARGISNKLVRRHPHVFGDAIAGNSDTVLSQWDRIKRDEKGEGKHPYLHGVGKGLPALLKAAKLQKKAAKVGFDWPEETGVIAKIREELAEYENATEETHATEELGDLLFSLVNLIRFRGLDPEIVMDAANRKFENRFGAMEQRLHERDLTLADASLEEMEIAWQEVK